MRVDNIPIYNKDRDKAWENFIKRKDVQEFFKDKDDTFKFPLERGWYEVWCQCWEKAWDAGWDAAQQTQYAKEKEDDPDYKEPYPKP